MQASDGRRSAVRTYQDLLSSPHDEALFEYHFRSQIATVTLATGSRTAIGEPGMYARVTAAPDTRHILVERVTTPWSRLVPASRFARSIEVWTRDGETRTVASRPLADTVPIGGVPTGPRGHRWHATERATLMWSEAQDGGDPKTKVVVSRRHLCARRPIRTCGQGNRAHRVSIHRHCVDARRDGAHYRARPRHAFDAHVDAVPRRR